MKTNESAPALKPGYYVAVPTGEPATKAWGVRPGVVEYCDPECGDAPHFRNAADHRMYEDPRDIGYTLYPVDALTAPQAAAEVHPRPSPLPQEQEFETALNRRLIPMFAQLKSADDEVDRLREASDAAQATAERLRVELATIKEVDMAELRACNAEVDRLRAALEQIVAKEEEAARNEACAWSASAIHIARRALEGAKGI